MPRVWRGDGDPWPYRLDRHGKTTAAAMFSRLGVPVYDADQAVHRLIGEDGAAVDRVESAFPEVVREGAVDRAALAQRVFGNHGALRRLEDILHPLVENEKDIFLRRFARYHQHLVVLDIPLLFETGSERDCDAVAVVSAPRLVQEQRLLSRPGMNRDRIAAILDRQLSDAEKRRRADFVVPTGLGRAFTLRVVTRIVEEASHWRGMKWPPRPPQRSLDVAMSHRWGVCRA